MKTEVEMTISLRLRIKIDAPATDSALHIAEDELELVDLKRGIGIGYSTEAVESVSVVAQEWGMDTSAVEL